MGDDDDPSPSLASDEKEEEKMRKTALDDAVAVDAVVVDAAGVVVSVAGVAVGVGLIGKKSAIIYYSDLDVRYYCCCCCYYNYCYNYNYYYDHSSHCCSYWGFSMTRKAGPNLFQQKHHRRRQCLHLHHQRHCCCSPHYFRYCSHFRVRVAEQTHHQSHLVLPRRHPNRKVEKEDESSHS